MKRQRQRQIAKGLAAILLLQFPPVFLMDFPVQDAAAGLGSRIRRISKGVAESVVRAALAGVSTSLLQVEAYAQRARQIQSELDQYRLLLRNAKRLSQWERQGVMQTLLRLDSVVKQGHAIAYSAADLDKQFREAYQGFEHYRKHPKTGENRQTYADLYRDWTRRGQDSIRGALRAAGLQSTQFKTETARMRQLENQLMSAQGTQQALQAGSLIASQQVSQLQQLRQLLMSQMQLQGNAAAIQLDRQALEDATLQRFLTPSVPRPSPQELQSDPMARFR